MTKKNFFKFREKYKEMWNIVKIIFKIRERKFSFFIKKMLYH